MKIAAIITCDIVNSTSLEPKVQRRLISSIQSILKEEKAEFYRGDSFQVYIANPAEALRILFKVRTTAKMIGDGVQCDVRSSIGIGEVKPPVRDLSTSNGEAFVLSGRGFELLTKDELTKIQSNSARINDSLRLIGYFADHLLSRVTAKQAAVVFELLNGKTQAEVARKLKKSQSTIQKHASGASWWQLNMLLREYENLIEQLHNS